MFPHSLGHFSSELPLWGHYSTPDEVIRPYPRPAAWAPEGASDRKMLWFEARVAEPPVGVCALESISILNVIQRCLSAYTPRLPIRPGVEQRPHHLGCAARGRRVQWG